MCGFDFVEHSVIEEYAESIWNQCRKKDVPFFFKQWGNNPNTQRLDLSEYCKEFPQ
ncbi:MAG: phage Gp37/Gp68 family protein [Helicobacter apodemus]|nr:phage Gp37/Gp68 family protein [Helicobacter apodemus]